VTTVAIEVRPSLWDRVSLRLRNWGTKLVAGAKQAGNWFIRAAKWAGAQIKRGAQWLFGTRAVQWTVDKAQFVGLWAWNLARGPVGFIALPILGLILAPKALAIMIFVTLLGIGILTFLVYQVYREVKKAAPEEIREMVAAVTEEFNAEHGNGTQLSFTEEPAPDETPLTRYAYLDQQNQEAAATKDINRFSESTARMRLLEVRAGRAQGKSKKNSSGSDIYRELRQISEKENPDFAWNWTLMYRAVLDENKRLKTIGQQKGSPTLTTV